mmetsp:Transcript_2399/g.5442  ORF Transcript_2399/g.5442 Transcript_2399/m.5442 type:complete len:290 (-) Transcript_2399:404-1273(-)
MEPLVQNDGLSQTGGVPISHRAVQRDGATAGEQPATAATEERQPLFQFAKPGHTPARSRDGSPNVTDEVFNAASHLVGSMLAIMGFLMLVVKSSVEGKPWHIVSFSIYGVCTIAVFVTSFLHHGLHSERFDAIFLMADYLAIYAMIAGTFTPLCLVYFNHQWIGWVFLGSIWFFALTGMSTHIVMGHDHVPKWLSMTIHGFMGWTGVFVVIPLCAVMPAGGICLIVLGGVLYTGGAVIFGAEKPNPCPGRFGFHEIWHLFVLLGALTHWLCMWFYVEPYAGPPALAQQA